MFLTKYPSVACEHYPAIDKNPTADQWPHSLGDRFLSKVIQLCNNVTIVHGTIVLLCLLLNSPESVIHLFLYIASLSI